MAGPGCHLSQAALPVRLASLRVPLTTHPSTTANITIFRPTSFFILVQTGLGLQVQLQLVPLMQVYVRLDPAYHGQMCGEALVALGPGWG